MKKIGLILGVLLGVGLAGSGGWWLWQTKNKPPAVAPTSSVTTPSAEVPLVTWDDPAGFTFGYPQEVAIDKHDEDQASYAHVELTHKNHPGNLIIWAKDTTAVDVTAWVRTEKTFTGASVLDTTLGNQPAKKVLLTTPTKKLVIGTVFDELLFFLEAKLDEEGYWAKVADTISQSFTFKPLLVTGETGGAALEEAVDEEEILE